VFGVSLFVIAFLTYLGIGLRKSQITATDNKIPALAFVLLFLIVACWGLSALTFFFDRYRFPLLWTLSAFSLITIISPQSDHFFRVVLREPAMREPPIAVAYMKKRLEIREQATKPKRLIIVATPGGGIQAAAWTAKVLTKLNDVAPGFRDSVAVISSVSGGSRGSMIYAASFAGNIGADDVAGNARRSAIDEVAWGWTVPDLWRVILPWFRTNRAIDRGWALERKWSAVNHLNDAGNPTGTTIGDRANYAWDGKMPALLINSMLVERGQPVVFSNTRFPAIPNNQARIANFCDLYPDQYLKLRYSRQHGRAFVGFVLLRGSGVSPRSGRDIGTWISFRRWRLLRQLWNDVAADLARRGAGRCECKGTVERREKAASEVDGTKRSGSRAIGSQRASG